MKNSFFFGDEDDFDLDGFADDDRDQSAIDMLLNDDPEEAAVLRDTCETVAHVLHQPALVTIGRQGALGRCFKEQGHRGFASPSCLTSRHQTARAWDRRSQRRRGAPT